jgi:glycosyltransferase involved in cell wall biosynthesis
LIDRLSMLRPQSRGCKVKDGNVAFVTHFCPHYRVKTFERLAQSYNVEFFFYSPGNEWYGQGIHGVRKGNFKHTYLPGFQLTSQIRIAPSLVTCLWRGEFDAVVKCINGRFALPATYLIARLRGIPFILWTGIWMSLETRFHRLAHPITRWVYRHADSIVVYGQHVRRYLIDQGVEESKIFVAAHAVDNALYARVTSPEEKATRKTQLSLEAQKVVLYLGRLEKIKGLEYLLEAFAQVKSDDSVLMLAGDGFLYDSLMSLAKELGIRSKTRFVGYVRPEDAERYYAIADLFVLPSVTMPTGKETWGVVVNEAMNQGLPVIATDAVGAAAGGLVQSGVNGLVVPERDSGALALAIERLLTNDRLRAEMSQNAVRIIAGWDNERMVAGFEHAIQHALRHAGDRSREVRRL